MKKIYLLTAYIFMCIPAFAQSLNWSSEATVANGSVYGNTRPRIAVASGNIPVVVWGSNSTLALNCARWNGTAFGMAMSITPSGVDPAVMSWQGHDFAANGNTMYAVFKSEPEMMGTIYIVKSTDGGITWGDTVRVDQGTGPYDRFPSVAVTSAGNPAVMLMTFDSSWMSATYKVTNSMDGGQTFGVPVNASGVGGSDVCDCCPGYITTDGNNQVAAWRRNNSNIRDMWAAVSTNGGTTFPTGLDLDMTNWMLMNCPSSGPSPFLYGDSLTTVFMSGASGNDRIYVTTYSISNQAMGLSMQINTGTADQNYPFIAGNGDTIMVVWQQQNGGQNDTYYSWSVTGASGLFTNATLLNSSTAGNQTNPHVAYSNGVFHVVFTDGNAGNVIYKSATIMPNNVENFVNAHAMNLYPNPSTSEINLNLASFAGSVQIILTDMFGRCVGVYYTRGGEVFILPKQDAGYYWVEVSDENGMSRSQVVFY